MTQRELSTERSDLKNFTCEWRFDGGSSCISQDLGKCQIHMGRRLGTYSLYRHFHAFMECFKIDLLLISNLRTP